MGKNGGREAWQLINRPARGLRAPGLGRRRSSFTLPVSAQIRMNSELIKKLKDAGLSLRHGDSEIERIRYDLSSLEELIEACTTNIGKATFVLGSANQGKEWVACYFDFVTNRGSDFNETGSTPVEAIAKLWLALHADRASA